MAGRAQFVLTKIDEILAWEQKNDAEHDTKFVELGRYLCEVRAGQYWRVENLKSFDGFLGRRFPESRRKAYYLVSIHEHLPPQARKVLQQVGWTKSALFSISLPNIDWQFLDFCPSSRSNVTAIITITTLASRITHYEGGHFALYTPRGRFKSVVDPAADPHINGNTSRIILPGTWNTLHGKHNLLRFF